MSKHPHWGVRRLCHSFFFRIPRLQALILLNTGWPVTFNLSTIWAAVESHFPSGVYGRVPHHFISSPKPRNVQCPCKNLFAWSLTFSEFEIQMPSCPLSVQSMSSNIDMKMIRSVHFSGLMFLFRRSSWIILKNLQCRKSWDNIPTRTHLLLHRFPATLCNKGTFWIHPLDLHIFQLYLCFHSSSPHMERNLSVHVLSLCFHWTTWSWDNANLVHEVDVLLIVFTFRISSECSNINFWVVLKKLWISSKFVFLSTSKFAK